MPSLLFLILLYQAPTMLLGIQESIRGSLMLIIFICTFAVPFLALFMLYSLRVIKNFHLPTKEERLVPFMMTTLLYAILTFFLNKIQANIDYKIVYIFFGITLSGSLLTVVTYFWKISAHTLALGGIIGTLFVFAFRTGDRALLLPITLLTLLAGVTVSARLALDAHKINELWSAFLMGSVVNAACLLWFY